MEISSLCLGSIDVMKGIVGYVIGSIADLKAKPKERLKDNIFEDYYLGKCKVS